VEKGRPPRGGPGRRGEKEKRKKKSGKFRGGKGRVKKRGWKFLSGNKEKSLPHKEESQKIFQLIPIRGEKKGAFPKKKPWGGVGAPYA